ncbi:hypothetical protein PSHT_12192 [Puccinia striiformis]|nr:hypothetical protein PSHT_12192 [Puccinia striiformis]
MAVVLATNVAGMANNTPRLNEGTPMDLDVVASDAAFTYTLFRKECIARGICQRCGEIFDFDHVQLRGCPYPESDFMNFGAEPSR